MKCCCICKKELGIKKNESSEDYLFITETGSAYIVVKDSEAGIKDIKPLELCRDLKGREFKLMLIV